MLVFNFMITVIVNVSQYKYTMEKRLKCKNFHRYPAKRTASRHKPCKTGMAGYRITSFFVSTRSFARSFTI